MVNINWMDDYTREIVVLNVDGSSPSGHPSKEIPASAGLQGFLIINYSVFDGTFLGTADLPKDGSVDKSARGWRRRISG